MTRPRLPGITPEQIDQLIEAMGRPEQRHEGLAHLVGKIDHLFHSMRMSGRLGELSREQVDNLLYALQAAGCLQDGVFDVLAGGRASYHQDGLITTHNADFMGDPQFVEAYRRGVQAAGTRYRWHWRVRVGLWAASHALHLDGDFVECGVNKGFLSSAVMRYLDWNALARRFFLFDTFQGLDERFISDEEKAAGKTSSLGEYTECFDEVQQNFSEFRNVFLIRGSIPLTLPLAQIDKVSYLHIDMNCVVPEIAAITYFWPKLVPGAPVLLDDYGFREFELQKRAMDKFAVERGVQVLSVPTGQGLILKPG